SSAPRTRLRVDSRPQEGGTPTKTPLTPSRAIPTTTKGHDGNERQRHNLKGFFTMSTATAKVVSAPNPDLKDFDPTQPTTFVAMIVENDRNRGSLTKIGRAHV